MSSQQRGPGPTGSCRDRRCWWIALSVVGCSSPTPPTAPVALSFDAGQGATVVRAGSAATSSVDPITKHALPQPPDPKLWVDVLRSSPEAVKLGQPGGDAPDPHAAGMVRLLEQPLGELRDKDNQVVLSYPDRPNWKRVRYRGFEHLVGFRYSDKFDAAVAVLAYDTRAGRVAESRSCIRLAETMARPRLRALSVEVGPIAETEIEWKGRRIVVHSVEGGFPWGFQRIEFSAAWAAYPAYEKACLVQGIGVKHENRADLARAVRDRWIREVAPNIETRTSTKPYRH